MEFVEKSPQASKYRHLASKVEESLRFMNAIGVDIKVGSPRGLSSNMRDGEE